MEKTVKVGKKSVRLSNNISWAMEYKGQFNKDPLEALMPLITAAMEAVASVVSDGNITPGGKLSAEDVAFALEGRAMDVTLPLMQLGLVDSVVNVMWAMAKAADENIAPPKEWVKQFESFPLDVIVPEVGSLLLKGFASSKNLARLTNLGNEIKKVTQPSQSKQSSSQVLSGV